MLGAPGAQAATLQNLSHLVTMLQPGDTWSTIGVGKFSLPMAAAAIAMGGHVRVGLEDNNKNADGTLASNVSLVKHVVELAKLMGRELATPDEARRAKPPSLHQRRAHACPPHACPARQARKILDLKPEWKDRILPQLKEPEWKTTPPTDEAVAQ